MNPSHQGTPSQSSGRAALGVVAKLLAIIVATFLFAAFSSAPAETQSVATAPTPLHSR